METFRTLGLCDQYICDIIESHLNNIYMIDHKKKYARALDNIIGNFEFTEKEYYNLPLFNDDIKLSKYQWGWYIIENKYKGRLYFEHRAKYGYNNLCVPLARSTDPIDGDEYLYVNVSKFRYENPYEDYDDDDEDIN